MAKWLLEDLESNIDPNQYGNMKGVSTSHYLVRMMDTLLENPDKPGLISPVVITDFTLGGCPSIVAWIANILDGREQ